MAKFKVVDQDNFEPGPGESLSQVDEVDRDGYRDIQTMVEEMLVAGEQLRAYRRGEFDIEEEEDFEAVDKYPAMSPGYDVADAQADLEILKGKIDLLKKTKEEAEKKASEEKTDGTGNGS